MNITNKKIGIWGFGVSGKAAAAYLHAQGAHLAIMESRPLTDQEQLLLQRYTMPLYHQDRIGEFFDWCDNILASPGIDLAPYAQYAHKWITELDIFGAHCKKPIIAITGTVGKTTVTSLLEQLLNQHGLSVIAGGNIGIGMLELLEQQMQYDAFLLEVSSFQLEHNKLFAPRLAIWTNLYANHLDRHTTLDQYIRAKEKIITHQKMGDQALAPLSLMQSLPHINRQTKLHYFAPERPSDVTNLKACDAGIYFLDNGRIIVYRNGQEQALASLAQLPPISYDLNWLILIAACHLLQVELQLPLAPLQMPEHRLEHVATIDHVDFYNDSKSTVAQATIAAVNALRTRPIILLLGGVSKGVDRTPLIAQLQGGVKKIICFGKQAELLKRLCDEYAIDAELHDTLDQAFYSSVNQARHNDLILLSPAGASFDLFADYKQRGDHFKKLVAHYHKGLL